MITWTALQVRTPADEICPVILRLVNGGEVRYELATWYPKMPTTEAGFYGTQAGKEWHVSHWAMVNAP